jgi:hypothetical protein
MLSVTFNELFEHNNGLRARGRSVRVQVVPVQPYHFQLILHVTSCPVSLMYFDR